MTVKMETNPFKDLRAMAVGRSEKQIQFTWGKSKTCLD